MLSVMNTVNELDRLDSIIDAIRRGYCRSLATVADHPSAADVADQQAFRTQVLALAEQLKHAETHPELAAIAPAFEEQIVGLDKKSRAYLANLQKELTATVTALQQVTASFASTGEDHGERLRKELDQLGRLSGAKSIEVIRVGLQEVHRRIGDAVVELQRQNQLVVAQLRDEIRALHEQIQRVEATEKRSAQKGTLFNRNTFELRVTEWLASRQVFCLLVVRLSNWQQIVGQASHDQADELLSHVFQRLQRAVGPETFCARWHEGYFASIVPLDKVTTMKTSKEIVGRLEGEYTLSSSLRFRIQVSTGVIDARSGDTVDTLLRRAGQLVTAFEQSVP